MQHSHLDSHIPAQWNECEKVVYADLEAEHGFRFEHALTHTRTHMLTPVRGEVGADRVEFAV